MNNAKQNFFKLGVFIIAGLLLFFVAIFLVGRQKNLFGTNFTLNTYYSNVQGLMVGNNVRFSGINVGTIDEIFILNDTTVQVVLLMKDEVRQYIRTDAKANISSDGLMGDKVIEIVPGSVDSMVVVDGGVIQSIKPFSTDDLLIPLKETAKNAQMISGDLAAISGNIKNGKGTIGRLFTDEDLADNISGTMTNVNKASKKLDENMEALKGNFLLKGYYKKKEKQKAKEEKARKDSLDNIRK